MSRRFLPFQLLLPLIRHNCPLTFTRISPQWIPFRQKGHAHWQNIKHVKEAKDHARSRVFDKLAQRIFIAVKENGGQTNPQFNAELKNILEECKANNMPKSTIEATLKRAVASKENTKPAVFEARGPGRSLLIIEGVSSNLSKLKNDLIYVLKKYGQTTMGSAGTASHAFQRRGVLRLAPGGAPSMEQAMDIAIEVGAEDVTSAHDEDGTEIPVFLCAWSQLVSIKQKIEAKGLKVLSARPEYIPTNPVELDPEDDEKLWKLIDKLEEHAEVVKVNANIDM